MPYRKTYQAIHFKDLDTYVVVNGQKVLVQFRGGSLQPRINGKFTAENQDLIKAMDADSGLGTSFMCIHSEGGPDVPATKASANEEDLDDLALIDTPEVPATATAEEDGVKRVPGITTIQAARAYLVDNLQIPISKMANRAAVKKYAAEHKIVFTDLQ